jgi:hypothetical protein
MLRKNQKGQKGQAALNRGRGAQRGQASIMIALMLMTFLFFFFFVVNIGMLVNAKINLQNAADMAAYAGAAVQARQLDQISYINYEMRRQYKKFLYRYYVIGNFQQAQFPRSVNSNTTATPMPWSPDGTTPYPAPMVCIAFNPADNYCQIAVQPGIAIPEGGLYDTINEALITQSQQFQQLLMNSCIQIGLMNQLILRYWLWNTDPNLQTIINAYNNYPTVQSQLRLAAGLLEGLGLIPRELILGMRINTLQDYVNAPAQTGVTLESAEGLASSADPAMNERTLQAFYSAFYTLGNHNFPSDTITMSEVLPTQMLNLKPVTAQFDAYSTYFNPTNAANQGNLTAEQNGTQPSQNCVGEVSAEVLHNAATFGYYKDPTVMTYYAVQLKAQVRVLFNPWDNLTLKAYAAAQPFGSRIGPVLDKNALIWPGINFGTLATSTAGAQGGTFGSLTYQIPNLPIRTGEKEPTQGTGWDTTEAMGTFYATTIGSIASPGNGQYRTFDQTTLDAAYQLAMAPNPYEEGNYNILSPNAMDTHFRNNYDGHEEAIFWAPIVSPLKGNPLSTASGQIQSELQTLLAVNGLSSQTSQALQAAVVQGLGTYMQSLQQSQGELDPGGTAESFNLVRLPDPLMTRPNPTTGAPAAPLAGLPAWLAIDETKPTEYMTSWDTPDDPKSRNPGYGRAGYSVKFVSFNSLTAQKQATTPAGTNSWSNDFVQDSEISSDMNGIQH